jgi:hypothetical protein
MDATKIDGERFVPRPRRRSLQIADVPARAGGKYGYSHAHSERRDNRQTLPALIERIGGYSTIQPFTPQGVLPAFGSFVREIARSTAR